MWMMLVSSFTDEGALRKSLGLVFFPKPFTLAAYRSVFSDNRIVSGFQSSVFLAIVGTLCTLALVSMAAYPLSKDLRYKAPIGFIFYFTVLFSGGMIPTFLWYRDLNLLNNIWSLILLNMAPPFYIILMRNFFAEIPQELEESALMDGAGRARVLLSIVLPLSKPVMATVGLMAMVGYWNSWFAPMIYMIGAKNQWPLSTILQQMLNAAFQARPSDMVFEGGILTPKESFKYATLIVTMTPILCVYPFAQKYFAKGLLIGAIKG